MTPRLNDMSVQYLKGVGPARKKLFLRLGIETIEDLLYFFPRRYEDRRQLVPIAQIKAGEHQTFTGIVTKVNSRRSWHTKKHLLEVTVKDQSGHVVCVWFSQPYLANYFRMGESVVCHGKVDEYKGRLQVVSPEYEMIEAEDKENLAIDRIVPMYSLTKGMTQRYLRRIIKSCLNRYEKQLPDELPVSLRNKYRFYNIKRSLHFIHFPKDFKDQEQALRRISFEEFYFFQLSMILRGLSLRQKSGISHDMSEADVLRFINGFPFVLTQAQKKVIQEIRTDMKRSSPMLRLLQGDVGSGKTLVALFGCLTAFKNGYQSALMAPTEILARQHYETIQSLIQTGPLKGMKIALLISGLKQAEKDQLYQRVKKGEIDCVIGTHALMTDQVRFKNLSFVVIDEQHKFGVRQRALLSEKGMNPHVLIMTATPIPRTLCITIFGDLDISILDELPQGRGQLETRLFLQEQASEVYKLVRKKVKEGQQVYIIYPIIEESEKLDLKAAQKMAKHFSQNEFKDYRVALVHGQMKREESDEVMSKFKKKEIDVLVATTVLEVGIDVPNANVMVIEHAERFGLAQLHQLRGRIGRGKEDALCLLISDPATDEAKQRLDAILSTRDGFEIAEKDLLIRGPGQFFGRHQHGLNELKVANPMTQLDMLQLARQEALQLTESDSQLRQTENQSIKRVIERRYPNYLEMVTAG